jgi:SPP1 family predicted phage head-tail adaptor
MATTTPSFGVLNQKVQLQARAAGVSAELGEPTGAWQNQGAPIWAEATPLRGREFFASGQMQATVDVRFRILYRAEVLSTWRVVWKGDPYAIVGHPIDVDGQGQWMELMCVKGTRDGQ